MGGSQASHRINIAFLEAASRLADKSRIQIIHLTGQADFGILEQGYGRLNLKARLFTFLPQMQFAYSCADLAISRAGATTIAELVFFSLPAILVPYPFAYEHQRANAGILAGRQAAEVINDRELNAEALARKLEFYIKNPDKIKKMRYNYSGMDSKDASDLLAQEVLSLI
jgi:UDP-N-acetylglucosamine--N-acetylmuramyl-(pentapeptide) pyrophosphoryl-undecaprenol N-acetylglucosamine transferase